MKNKITVSVGIAALNEEKNIVSVIMDVLLQKGKNWDLKEILVYSDGSTDSTGKKILSLKSSKIKFVNGTEQLGKVKRVQQMCADFRGDVLILLDADIHLNNRFCFDDILSGFDLDSKIMVSGGNTRPYPPKEFFERSVYSTFLVHDGSRLEFNEGNNIFGCSGKFLAIKKEFSKLLVFPNVMNEDDFIYFSCISKGFKFKHIRSAIAYYKLPKNLFDYLRQSFRSNPEAVEQNFKQHFGDLVKKEYHRPLEFLFKTIFGIFKKYPLETMFMIVVNLTLKPFFPLISKNYKLKWYIASSTK